MSAFREVMETHAALVGGIGVESRATIPQSGKDVTDSPARHPALQQSSLGHPGQRHVDRIRRRAHDLQARTNTKQRGKPAASPIAARRVTSHSTILTTSVRVAPRVMRMPISRVR